MSVRNLSLKFSVALTGLVLSSAFSNIADAGIINKKISYGDGSTEATEVEIPDAWNNANKTNSATITTTIETESIIATFTASSGDWLQKRQNGAGSEIGIGSTGDSDASGYTNSNETLSISFNRDVWFRGFDMGGSNSSDLFFTSEAFKTTGIVTGTAPDLTLNSTTGVMHAIDKVTNKFLSSTVASDFRLAAGDTIVIKGGDQAGMIDWMQIEVASAIVPEPSSALLAGLSLLGLGFVRRRRNS